MSNLDWKIHNIKNGHVLIFSYFASCVLKKTVLLIMMIYER